MSFTVRGTYAGEDVEVTWVGPGAVTGPSAVLDDVRRTIAQGETMWATPTGPALDPSVEEPLAALLTIRQVVDVVEVLGDRPTVESIPGVIY